MDRERGMDQRRYDRPPYSPPRRHRGSPSYDLPPGPPPPPPPPKDPATAIIEELDSENRSVFVSQIAARMTSNDLGLFFEDKLGRGSVRDARVVMDRGSRRSKGCVRRFGVSLG
jgi:RNA-binding protein 39